jgi:hypothetical protein
LTTRLQRLENIAPCCSLLSGFVLFLLYDIGYCRMLGHYAPKYKLISIWLVYFLLFLSILQIKGG